MVAGTVLNLSEHIHELTKPVSDGTKNSLIDFITLQAVNFGFYSGWIAGSCVDALGTSKSFVLAAIVSAISFTTLALLATTTWNTGIGVLVIIYLFVAGFSASIAVLNTIQAIIKNFDK